MSNLTDTPIHSIFEENLNLGYDSLIDDCGTVWNKIGIQTFTGIQNVKNFGATGLGVIDDTLAFYNAMEALPNGGVIIVPPGLYAVNLILVGNNYTFIFQQAQYSKVGTFGLCPFDTTIPVVQFGDGTTTTSDIRLIGAQIRPRVGIGGTKGVKFYGCNRCKITGSVIRAFDNYQIQLDSSASKDTSYIHVIDCEMATAGVGGSLGIDFNYGGSSVTAVYLRGTDISAANGGSYLLDLAASCQLRISNCWLQGGDGMGIHFQAANAILKGHNTIVDSNSSNDILVTCDFDGFIPIHGDIEIDGKATMSSGTTEVLTARDFIPYHTLLLYPQIQQTLGFQDSAASFKDQYDLSGSESPQNIKRSGTSLVIQSEDGNILLGAVSGGLIDAFEGVLQLRKAAIAATSGITLGSATQTTVGAAGAASALPGVPTGYLRFFIGSSEFVIPYWPRV